MQAHPLRRSLTVLPLLALLGALAPAHALPQLGNKTQVGPKPTAQLGIALVLVPEEGETSVEEELIFDYVNDMAPLIQAGYDFVFPDLPVRAFRDTDDKVQMILPVSGLAHFSGTYLGDSVRLVGDDFDDLSPCIGSTCLDRCTGSECFVAHSDGMEASCEFNDQLWLGSIYRIGNDIHAVTHMEYEAQARDWADFPGGQPADCDSCGSQTPSCCNGIPRVKGLQLNNITDFYTAGLWCQHTSYTYAKSTDDGATFEQADDWNGGGIPDLVAYGPYEFVPDAQDHLCLADPLDPDSPKVTCPNSGTPYGGFGHPSNIVKHPSDGYYYMMGRQHLPPRFIDDYPGVEQLWAEVWNSIIMRTDDLSDPASWRAFGGDFDTFGEPIYDVQLIDPYRTSNVVPEDHVAYPLNPFWQYAGTSGVEDTIGNFSGSLHWNAKIEKWVLMDAAPVVIEGQGNYGVFFSLSDDLIHWTERRLTDPPITARLTDRPLYPVVIDHDTPSINFDRADGDVYIYLQRVPPGQGYHLEADVWRVKAEFQYTGL